MLRIEVSALGEIWLCDPDRLRSLKCLVISSSPLFRHDGQSAINFLNFTGSESDVFSDLARESRHSGSTFRSSLS